MVCIVYACMSLMFSYTVKVKMRTKKLVSVVVYEYVNASIVNACDMACMTALPLYYL